MAQDFKRYIEKSIGTNAVDIPDAANFTTNDTIIGINLANRSTLAIKASAYLLNSAAAADILANRYYLVKDAPIPTGGALQIMDGGAKIVVQSGDRLNIISDTASSIDAWVSVVAAISA
jgi:hypothetical protein